MGIYFDLLNKICSKMKRQVKEIYICLGSINKAVRMSARQ